MTLAKGAIEILELTAEKESTTFSDYTEIVIDGKQLSSATVSKRLKELVAIDALKETEERTSTGRKTKGYELTPRGEKIVQLADEYEAAMEEVE